ncbi:uncharacterized protein LOC144885289 [Branchiostoma floridae x Branchiostoma japonicum]
MSASWVFLFGLLLVVSAEREALWLGDYSVEDLNQLHQIWTKEARAVEKLQILKREIFKLNETDLSSLRTVVSKCVIKGSVASDRDEEFCDRMKNMITAYVDKILEEASEDGGTGDDDGSAQGERRALRRRGYPVGTEDLAQDQTEDMKLREKVKIFMRVAPIEMDRSLLRMAVSICAPRGPPRTPNATDRYRPVLGIEEACRDRSGKISPYACETAHDYQAKCAEGEIYAPYACETDPCKGAVCEGQAPEEVHCVPDYCDGRCMPVFYNKTGEGERVKCASEEKGQCPAVPYGLKGSCAFECSTDNECKAGQKCCSNGCGKQCVRAQFKTNEELSKCKLGLGEADDEGNQKLWLFRPDEKGGKLFSTDARGDGRSFTRFPGTRQEMAEAIREGAPKGHDEITVPGSRFPVMWKVEDGKIFRGVAAWNGTLWRVVAFCNFDWRSRIKAPRQNQNGETSTIGGKDVAWPAQTTPAPENRATKLTESSLPQDDEGSETFSGKYPPDPREV